MDNDSPESWHFTEGGVYVGGGRRGAEGNDHDAGEGDEGGAVHQKGSLNQHMGLFEHSSEVHRMGVASKESPLREDHPDNQIEIQTIE